MGDDTLFADLYELTMMQGYFLKDHNPEAVFDLYFRSLPENRGYLVAAGLEQVIEYIEDLSFSDEDLDYLEEQGFHEEFLEYLEDFEFTGDIRAVPEGNLVFPDEPIIEVRAPLIQAQLLETFLINQVSFQTLVATKAARTKDIIRRLGSGQSLIDFGSRRAHGTDAGMKAARAAYIGGFQGTSNVKAAKKFGIPAYGTMAHSWVQSFEDEREAFEEYLDIYGESSILLVDTYDTLQGSEIAREVCDQKDLDIRGVRLDSGDLVELSKKVDEKYGFNIFVSSGLDEYRIMRFLRDGGVARGFGVGTRLVTSSDTPDSDCVYKLVEIETNGSLRPETKLSKGKTTLPGIKTVRRITENGEFKKDILDLRGHSEEGKELLVDIYEDGELVYEIPDLDVVRERCANSVEKMPIGSRMVIDPDEYSVEIGEELEDTFHSVKRRIKRRNY